VNDLIGNSLGILLGWIAIMPFLLRHPKY
jgi:glycopeptide antibiotics resistance protein